MSTEQKNSALPIKKILVSACLLGQPVRYDGKPKTQRHAGLDALVAQQRVVAFCPEVSGGLPVPRPAAEIQAGNGSDVLRENARVKTRDGCDVTEFFLAGAHKALALCQENGITLAVLTEFSPSCASQWIYDGGFRDNKVAGTGVTTALLRSNGIEVFSHLQLDAAMRRFKLELGAFPDSSMELKQACKNGFFDC